MRRTVSFSRATLALFCMIAVLFTLPASAQNRGGILPGTSVTPSDFSDGSDDPRVLTVESRGCRVPEQGATVTVQDDDGARFKYRDVNAVEIRRVGNGQVRLESRQNDSIVSGTDLDPNASLTAVGSTGINGCRGENTAPADDQYDSNDTDDPDDVVPNTTSKKRIPNTGGPPYLAFGALLLLCASLLLGRGVLRR